jgi:uncharacterized protein (DUF58 family)
MPMKRLRLVPVLLLLAAGMACPLAAAELTASQQVPPRAPVGQTVVVNVQLYNGGGNSMDVVVSPNLPAGLETEPGPWPAKLDSRGMATIRYPFRAVQSGSYWIVSQISYSEEGTWRNLALEDHFTAVSPVVPGPEGPASPGSLPGQEGHNSPEGQPGQDGASSPAGALSAEGSGQPEEDQVQT